MKQVGELTPKQEAFAQSYMDTGNASEAYRRAYDAENMKDTTVNRKAKECIDNGKIAARVKELRDAAADQAVLSRSFILNGLMSNATKAAQGEDFTASNKAFELLGKTDEMALFVERQKIDSDNRHHHSAEPVSAFDDFLAGSAGASPEESPEKPVPN